MVADVREEAARARAARYGIPAVATSTAELLRHPVDVVHSCVANVAHAEVAEEVLAAGRHVVAEKPLAMDEAAARRLAAAAQAAGVVHAVCFTRRHLPAVLRLREDVAAANGGAHLVRGGYLQDWLLRRDQWDWRLDRALSGRLGDARRPRRALPRPRRARDRPARRRDPGQHRAAARRARRRRPAGGARRGARGPRRAAGAPRRRGAGQRDAQPGQRRLARPPVPGALAGRPLAGLELRGRRRRPRRAPGQGLRARSPWRPRRPAAPPSTRSCPDVYTAIRGGEPAAQPATFVDGLHSVQLIDAALRSAADGPLGRRPGAAPVAGLLVPVARSWYFEDHSR